MMNYMSLATLALLAAPTQQAPVGWRGDGTGKYPTAHPPTSWSRVSKPVGGLRYHAAPPGASDAGQPMPDGVVREWLVLSPAPEGAKVDQPLSFDEAGPAPREGEKVGAAEWKKVPFETAWMDFARALGKPERQIACAATNVFSETGGPFRINATQLGGFRIVLNGKPLPVAYGRYSIQLEKGWNRLLVKVAPRDADWACSLSLHARAPAEYESKGIAWTVALPGVTGGFYGGGTGCGSPIVVGDRIFLLSEPHDLICLDTHDGKVLWVRTNSYFDAATDADRKRPAYAEAQAIATKLDGINAALRDGPLRKPQLEEKSKLEADLYAKMQEVDPVAYKKPETPDVGFSGLTPVSDGKSVFVWLATGVTACWDLEGRRRWIRVDNLPAIEHGFSSSPLLVDGKIVVFMRDVLAFDAATGALAWRIPLVSHQGANPEGYFHGTPARASVGGAALIVLGNGTFVRARDGKILAATPEIGRQAICSPVVEGDALVQIGSWTMKMYLQKFPSAVGESLTLTTRSLSIDTPGFPRYYLPWHMASPVVHQGLAYLVNNAGVLTVVDLSEGKILYRRMLDLDHFETANEGPARGIGISPSLAGNLLYFFGNSGGAVVIEPGRTFKQVAKNKIENVVSIGHWGERQERFVSTPAFDGRRLYLRGEGHLYALDAQAAAREIARAESVVDPATPRPARPAVVPPPRPSSSPEAAPSPFYGWRRDGSGTFPGAVPPTEWGKKKNVKWRTEVAAGHSSPILAGDRVIVLSEPGTLVCLGRADGKILWTADLHRDLPAEVQGKIRPPVGTSNEQVRGTPVADETHVYATLCDGLVACYALSGKRSWVRYVEPPRLSYGPSASPVRVGNLLLVDSTPLQAIEAATGRPVWKAEGVEAHYGTPAVFSLGGIPLAITAKGAVVRVSDGAVLARDLAPGAGGDQAPTPLVRDGVAYFAYRRCSAVKLGLKDGALVHEKLWEKELPSDVIASPVLKDGMLFVIPSGEARYTVLEARTGETLLQKVLELSPNLYPSIALAGDYLFVGNDKGETLVLEPTSVSRQIRRNELPNGSFASPVFAGPHLFLRDGELLYCFGP